jgi:propanol-preferring alcohol dehydrogenase
VRVEACGLCRTDLHIVDGEIPLPALPIVPGHQAVGTVVAGEGGKARELEGARVGVAWLRSACGACADCRRGDENLCGGALFTGYHRNGGFAEYVAAPAEFVHPLRSPEPLRIAPLLCAGIIGWRALKRAGLGRGENVGLYGFGSSAHIALQCARLRGNRVFVVTRGERHLELAREMGAAWAGGAGERPPEPLDRAVIFAPAGELLRDALEAVRRGGTVASACIHMTPVPPLDYDRHLFGEKTLTSTTANTRADARELLALAPSLETRVTAFPFERLPDGLEAIRRDRVRGSAVLSFSPAPPAP